MPWYGSQAVELQLELFCLFSLFLSSNFRLLTSPYQGSVKIVYCAVLRTSMECGTGGEWWGVTPCCWTCTYTCTQQMVQEGALNKHTHLLADRRLGVRQCPLMNVYRESKGPSSFRRLSMRCSIMTMVIPPSLHNNHTQVMVSKWFISITHIRQMLLHTRVNLSCRQHRAHAKREKVFRKIYC